MSFRYLAYGSNLWTPQMRSRCPSATPIGTATIDGWRLLYDKPSTDGSAKLNIRPHPSGEVEGVVYRIDDDERRLLDEAEPRYTATVVDVGGKSVLTYTYQGEPTTAAPYDWYVTMAKLGAASHGLDVAPYAAVGDPDPLAPGLRPATLADLTLIQSILSAGLAAGTDRYFIHPGEFAWWIYHDDPRHPDHLSTWIQDGSGFVTIDASSPHEVSVFTRPGIDRMPLIRWAQRRLGGAGEVGWIADEDQGLIDELVSAGLEANYVNLCYRWDLTGALPAPDLPVGWRLRPVAGEAEANARRAASHAAFESTMPDVMHLQRYLNFMRSPVYEPERDLVAVAPDGTVAAFMVWWADSSGVAQIEPFGTHPGFQRRGIGRALIYHGLNEMRNAGMHTARVVTDESRQATAFYAGVGFRDAGRLRWWGRA